MIKLKLIYILQLIIATSSFSLFATDSIIIWSKSVNLQRSDFLNLNKPIADDNSKFLNTDENALLDTGIKVHLINENSNITVNVIPYVNKNNSWLYSLDTTYSTLLHEQLHFNITELIARKIRLEIMSMKKKGIQNITCYIDIINTYVSDSLSSYQHEFDQKTLNGTLKSVQIEYSNLLEQELHKYNRFSTDLYDFSDELIMEIFNSIEK